MKKFVLCITYILLFFSLKGFAYRYAFDSIPDNLKRGADAVVRTEQMTFSILSEGKAINKVKMALTLLNENADYYRYATVYYNKFIKVNYIKASVYDEAGKLIKIIRGSDIFDMSAISGGEFYSDDRKKMILFPKMKYPFTIEYEYELSISSLLNYPAWSFQDNPDVSVEKSGVQYLVPKNMKIKFKEVNLKSTVDSISVKDKIVYTWQEENIPTVRINSYGIPFTYRTPHLLSAPYVFEVGGYKGSLESWKSFGEWNRKIIEGRDILPESEIKKVKDLVQNVTDERQKVKVIYEYMQSKTRYLSLNLGIGGWQPFEAKIVSEKGYGDCKALTNYTMALLNAVGVKSYYTLVNSGDNENIDKNFVSNQFDHIILCVPQAKDTIWLECTSQTLPFNYLGSFTSNRYVLLTTNEGGKLAHTPEFKKEDNLIKRNGVVNINQLGNSTTSSFNTYYTGMFYDGNQDLYLQQSNDEIKRILNKTISFPTFTVDSVSYNDIKSENPSFNLNYKLNIRDFCVKGSNRLYFKPCIDKLDYLLNDPFSIQILSSYTVKDSIVYNLPYGYSIEYIPDNKCIETPFGNYNYRLSTNERKVVFTRNLEINKGNYNKDKFNDFHTFINSVALNDRGFVILKKNSD